MLLGARSNDGVARPIAGVKSRLNPQRVSALLAAALACSSPGVVNPVVVMVVRVIADQPAEMLFVQSDDMVKDLAPATSHPSFSDPILPGRLDTRSLGFKPVAFRNVITSASNFESWSRMM